MFLTRPSGLGRGACLRVTGDSSALGRSSASVEATSASKVLQVRERWYGLSCQFISEEAGPLFYTSGFSLLVAETGVVMGTVQYMSPEQVLGKEVDHRTDLFSLGVVLYEMATGRLPFTGTSSSETMDRVLHGQPEAIARLNYDVPAELERIIRKCLEKDRERRYQSARDLLIDPRNLQRDTQPAASAVVEKHEGRRRLTSWHLIGIAVPAMLALVALVYVFLFSYRCAIQSGCDDSWQILSEPGISEQEEEPSGDDMQSLLFQRL